MSATATATVTARRDPARSATPFSTRLALHALIGPRDRLEPRHRNAIATDLAVAVRTVFHARERLGDVVDGLARRGRECEIALALDAQRVALARLFVELRVARFAFVGQR